MISINNNNNNMTMLMMTKMYSRMIMTSFDNLDHILFINNRNSNDSYTNINNNHKIDINHDTR